MNIQILGHVNIDENTSEHSSYVGAGGPPMFMNKIFRQFPDCNVSVVASYGADFLQYLQGVNIYPQSPNCKRTLAYENMSKKGTRIQKARYRDEARPVPIDQPLRKMLKEADLIFFTPLIPNFPESYFSKVTSCASKRACKILLPQGFYRDFDNRNNMTAREFSEEREIIPLVNVVVVSEQDHPDIFQDAKKWAKDYGVLSIVTAGKKGAVAFKGSKEINLPTRPLSESKIVDSVGSGDIFSAGFAYRYRQTNDVKEAGRFANALARQCLFYTSDKIQVDLPKLLNTKPYCSPVLIH